MNAPLHQTSVADTLARIETLSANEALLQSRLGECVNKLKYFKRICVTWGWHSSATEVQELIARSEDALRTVSALIESRQPREASTERSIQAGRG